METNKNTQKEIILSKLQKIVFLYVYHDKNKTIKQLYTVDISKEVIISGKNEKGYMLKFYPENSQSNSCITYFNILDILHKGQKKFDYYDVYSLINDNKTTSNINPIFQNILKTIHQ